MSEDSIRDAADALGFLEREEDEEDLEPWKLNPDQIKLFEKE